MDRDVNVGPFLHGDGRHSLARFGGDWESQGNHVIPSRHSPEHPDDGVQAHRLLIQQRRRSEPRDKQKRADKKKHLEGGLRICHSI